MISKYLSSRNVRLKMYERIGGRAKLKKYLFLMPMASLGKKKFM